MKKLRILLTNDDGINAPGIGALYEAVKSIAEVCVIAPISEQSAVGHAITISDPLRVEKIYKDRKFFGYGINGTPSDCVKIAVNALLKYKPDMVISGINLGPNIGISVLYSGTVSGATEGAILGIPSMAVSMGSYENPRFNVAADFIKTLVKKFMKQGIPQKLLWNINVPNLPKSKIKGVKVTKQGTAGYDERYEVRVDPRKRTYYWLSGNKPKKQNASDIDVIALKKGYITIVPVQYDMTDYAQIDDVRRIIGKIN